MSGNNYDPRGINTGVQEELVRLRAEVDELRCQAGRNIEILQAAINKRDEADRQRKNLYDAMLEQEKVLLQVRRSNDDKQAWIETVGKVLAEHDPDFRASGPTVEHGRAVASRLRWWLQFTRPMGPPQGEACVLLDGPTQVTLADGTKVAVSNWEWRAVRLGRVPTQASPVSGRQPRVESYDAGCNAERRAWQVAISSALDGTDNSTRCYFLTMAEMAFEITKLRKKYEATYAREVAALEDLGALYIKLEELREHLGMKPDETPDAVLHEAGVVAKLYSKLHKRGGRWRPMDTAPKDGSWVYLSVPWVSRQGSSIYQARYLDGRWVCPCTAQVDSPSAWMAVPTPPVHPVNPDEG
jgi:hypothetical protein